MGHGPNAVLAAIAVLLAASCSVKENREDCPCRLDITISEEISSQYVSVSGNGGAGKCFDAVIAPLHDGTNYSAMVPRGMVELLAFDVHGGLSPRNGVFLIPCGSQADSIYAFRAGVDCSGETASASVVTRKQFATVFLRVVSENPEIAPGTLVRVDGEVCGLDAVSLLPVAGEFRCGTALDADLGCSFRVPRQADGKLVVTLGGKGDMCSFDAAPIISSGGYDWTDDVLDDILLDAEIGSSDVVVNVSILDWSRHDLEESL